MRSRPPQLEFAFEAAVELTPPQDLGMTPVGHRRIINIAGGQVTGPRLTGRILPGGADWQVIRPDGTADLHARYTIEAADGALIYVQNIGYRYAEPPVLKRLTAGEMVPADEYYFMATPRFETSAPAHEWLNRTILVAEAAREPDTVRLRFYAVL
ncbi:MAG: DUF3237 domain-containing protein [Alphaproteobacteria bacterium]